jgi:hypothetical protein
MVAMQPMAGRQTTTCRRAINPEPIRLPAQQIFIHPGRVYHRLSRPRQNIFERGSAGTGAVLGKVDVLL